MDEFEILGKVLKPRSGYHIGRRSAPLPGDQQQINRRQQFRPIPKNHPRAEPIQESSTQQPTSIRDIPPEPSGPPTIDTPKTVCWRCDPTGHFFSSNFVHTNVELR